MSAGVPYRSCYRTSQLHLPSTDGALTPKHSQTYFENRCLESLSRANVPVGRQLETLNYNCLSLPPPSNTTSLQTHGKVSFFARSHALFLLLARCVQRQRNRHPRMKTSPKILL
ncbi:hypothetical protein TNIN_432751 [Trichonephila inaurata madagascariensis]|uniref:Uncharacterized protein n=1 Tax=Trichonephila inaurata madagascariensis TaxID=2747483 RepID=A0A8X7C6N7_9ARAC|nr:hypothetical protein TNIN_432751 [Trichonephila inaurata madagascariensis]